MAYYNNGYPYQQAYQPMQPMMNQQNQGGIIWVQGEAAAKSYLVAPGATVQLWDSEEKVIYLKKGSKGAGGCLRCVLAFCVSWMQFSESSSSSVSQRQDGTEANSKPAMWTSLVAQWLSLPANAGVTGSILDPGRSHMPQSS